MRCHFGHNSRTCHVHLFPLSPCLGKISTGKDTYWPCIIEWENLLAVPEAYAGRVGAARGSMNVREFYDWLPGPLLSFILFAVCVSTVSYFSGSVSMF